jgi:hypothetical protein
MPDIALRPAHDMSYSQWKLWQKCPTQAYAKYVLKQYRQPKNEALAVGSLVDALLLDPPSEARVLADFEEQLFKKAQSGPLKGSFVVPNAAQEKARAWASHIRANEQAMNLIGSCRTQVSVTIDIGGYSWVCIFDLVRPESRLVCDMKTAASANSYGWVPRLGRRASFIAEWAYGYQLALYRYAAAKEFGGDPSEWTCGFFVIGKDTIDGEVLDKGLVDGDAYPDVRVFQWDNSTQLDGYFTHMASSMISEQPQLDSPRKTLPPIMAMKQAESIEGLPRCEDCSWCKTHRTDLITMYSDPEPAERRYGSVSGVQW